MLRNIPQVISPDLMKHMLEMGHGDRLILADANFPAAANAKRLLRMDDTQIPALLEAILPFFPLDNFVEDPVLLMQPGENEPQPEIWENYRALIRRHDLEHAFTDFCFLQRLPFYTMAREAYIIVQTATKARYANIVLQKGVL